MLPDNVPCPDDLHSYFFFCSLTHQSFSAVNAHLTKIPPYCLGNQFPQFDGCPTGGIFLQPVMSLKNLNVILWT